MDAGIAVDSTIVDNPDQGRFEIYVDQSLAGFAEYQWVNGVVTFTHTEVCPGFGGRGLGSALVAHALDAVRARGGRVVPQCEFVRAFISRRPTYQDMVA